MADERPAERWLSAKDAKAIVAKAMDELAATKTIAARAHAGLIPARAHKFITDDREQVDCDVPQEFWWAHGEAALEQNWVTGDFSTWIDREKHYEAFGVSFGASGINQVAGPSAEAEPSQTGKGGRPPAAFWDDLWIEMCRALYVGDLKPQSQAQVENAMKSWLSVQNFSAADSTVRGRARKLWQAIEKQDENQ